MKPWKAQDITAHSAAQIEGKGRWMYRCATHQQAQRCTRCAKISALLRLHLTQDMMSCRRCRARQKGTKPVQIESMQAQHGPAQRALETHWSVLAAAAEALKDGRRLLCKLGGARGRQHVGAAAHEEAPSGRDAQELGLVVWAWYRPLARHILLGELAFPAPVAPGLSMASQEEWHQYSALHSTTSHGPIPPNCPREKALSQGGPQGSVS